MPKPKYNPWSKDKKRAIVRRIEDAGYNTVSSFIQDVNELGLHMDYQAFLRRLNGETPCDPNEFWYYMRLLKMPVTEAASYRTMVELFTREPPFFVTEERYEASKSA